MISIGYAAGLFDGEGYAGVTTSAEGYTSLRLTVTQNDRTPLDALVERWGGNVYREGTTHRWRPRISEAVAFLTDVTPELIVKRETAEQILHWVATRRRKQWTRRTT